MSALILRVLRMTHFIMHGLPEIPPEAQKKWVAIVLRHEANHLEAEDGQNVAADLPINRDFKIDGEYAVTAAVNGVITIHDRDEKRS